MFLPHTEKKINMRGDGCVNWLGEEKFHDVYNMLSNYHDENFNTL